MFAYDSSNSLSSFPSLSISFSSTSDFFPFLCFLLISLRFYCIFFIFLPFPSPHLPHCSLQLPFSFHFFLFSFLYVPFLPIFNPFSSISFPHLPFHFLPLAFPFLPLSPFLAYLSLGGDYRWTVGGQVTYVTPWQTHRLTSATGRIGPHLSFSILLLYFLFLFPLFPSLYLPLCSLFMVDF